MKIVISLENNNGLDSTASAIFGRCPFYMLIDPESMDFTIEANPAQQATGGAGIQAAQWVIDQDAGVVISGNLGPKAFDVLAAGKIAAYKHQGGSVQAVIDAYQQKKLECLLSPSAEAHSGMG